MKTTKADDGSAVAISNVGVKTYPPCGVKYSEYTLCEDAMRSLKLNRDRLIYRELYCSAKRDLLKCCVSAPHSHKNPFKWPASRDLVWYANLPHKELMVKKAVQNWIRYEGDNENEISVGHPKGNLQKLQAPNKIPVRH